MSRGLRFPPVRPSDGGQYRPRMNALIARGTVVALLVSAAVSDVGCSTDSKVTRAERIDFTNSLRASWNLSDDEIRQLQFYTHDAVTLERDVGGDIKSIIHGRLVVRAGHNIEVIEIPAETPGVATGVSNGVVDVCFEGACDSTLSFQYLPYGNYPNSDNYVTKVNVLSGKSGSVVYDGNVYTLHPLTFLQIDTQSLRRTENRRIVPGKRIDERPAQ
jgi:hypothetical protein